MYVKLLRYTPEPEQLVAAAAKLCYSTCGIDDLLEKLDDEKVQKFLNHLMSLGHESPLEHVSFTFGIEGVSRACYDAKTEILTLNGWKRFNELHDGEVVATLNDKTQKVEFQKITERIQYQYTGLMHHIKSQPVDLRITDNHNIYFKKQDAVCKHNNHRTHLEPIGTIKTNKLIFNRNFDFDFSVDDEVVVAGYTYMRGNNCGGQFEKKVPDLVFPKDVFVKFLAWYLSDGSTYYDSKENKYIISITQKNTSANLTNHTVDQICTLIRQLGLTPVYDGSAVKCNSLCLGRFLKSLGRAIDKYIPYDIYTFFDKKYALMFLEEYLKADGSTDANGCSKLYTSSIRLSDQLQQLVFLAGWTCIEHIKYRGMVGQKTIIRGNECTINAEHHVLNISKDKRNRYPYVQLTDHRTTELVKDEMVYCVSVPNKIIFVRRNGKAVWCGNCLAQITRHRIASFSVQSQRYCNLEDSFTYITPMDIADNQEAKEMFDEAMNLAHTSYVHLTDILQEQYEAQGIDAKTAEKKAIENARAVLPNACETKMIVTMNARSLLNFFELRTCNRAQQEIKELAIEMMKQCKEVAPILFKNAGPSCVRGKCKEGSMSCGKPWLKASEER